MSGEMEIGVGRKRERVGVNGGGRRGMGTREGENKRGVGVVNRWVQKVMLVGVGVGMMVGWGVGMMMGVEEVIKRILMLRGRGKLGISATATKDELGSRGMYITYTNTYTIKFVIYSDRIVFNQT